MLSDEIYDLCRPILENKELEDEDKTEQLEELLRKETSLTGAPLENNILDALWRHRNAAKGELLEAPLRHTIIRKSSPAPWQLNRVPTPLGSPPSGSPAIPPGFPSRPSFSRQKSSVPSPFASPRPSPRLAMAQPIPHSPNLNAYEFSEHIATPDVYGDYGSDNVDWLVADETASNASSTGTGQLSAAAPEWTPQPDMSPYDILRSVLGDKKTDDEIEEALDKTSYDLGATIALLTGTEQSDALLVRVPSNEGNILVGKSMAVNQVRPTTPNTSKSPIVCKYWLASGSCLRADCRFAHDTSSYVCKYWMNGACLAGDSCQFSHDPALLVGALSVNENSTTLGTPPQSFQLDSQYEQFPSLQSNSPKAGNHLTAPANGHFPNFTPLSQQRGRGGFQNLGSNSRPQSRPNSRHQHRPDFQTSLSMDDQEAFPTLSSLNNKRTTKHHGQRTRHGHTQEPANPSSLADVVRMSPSPAPGQLRQRTQADRKIRISAGSDSAAARKIPEPQHIPWLETGAKANQQYLKYRQEAIKHGSVRNKFLQSAAQAWNRNDARAAKALSLRGQAENDAMRRAHRDAARALYEERNPHLPTSPSDEIEEELYIDLHGLHPEEAIEYLSDVLTTHQKKGRRVIYAITGTGHHSKNGKDKVGKGVRGWLGEGGYVFREFSVPGERGGYIGGVLGIDVSTGNGSGSVGGNGGGIGKGEDGAGGMGSGGVPVGGDGKIRVLRREDVL